MMRSSLPHWTVFLALLGLSLVHAHTVIVYPGYRGNNLHTNGTVEAADGLGVAADSNGSYIYPYGMQWAYPCTFLPLPCSMKTKLTD